jgi:mono/diheme cytochrome c family protein
VIERSKGLFVSAALSLTLGLLGSGAATAAGFTAEQAEAGKPLYDSNCAQCHGFQLEGPDAPGLAGRDVMQNWYSAGGLYDFISVAMPPSAPGLLGEEAYINIVAYIMSFNGAQPGDTPMTTDPELLASISLPEETAAGAAATPSAPAEAATATPETTVPQAFTWGKQLPGGAPPAAPAPTAAAEPSVPQAFTYGKPLPGATN